MSTFSLFFFQGLRKNYGKFEEILKVDRIIFLASATESVPVNLIHSVREAARPSGDDGNIRGKEKKRKTKNLKRNTHTNKQTKTQDKKLSTRKIT